MGRLGPQSHGPGRDGSLLKPLFSWFVFTGFKVLLSLLKTLIYPQIKFFLKSDHSQGMQVSKAKYARQEPCRYLLEEPGEGRCDSPRGSLGKPGRRWSPARLLSICFQIQFPVSYPRAPLRSEHTENLPLPELRGGPLLLCQSVLWTQGPGGKEGHGLPFSPAWHPDRQSPCLSLRTAAS